MNNVWITSLGTDPEPVMKLIGSLRLYGIDANGKFFNDNIEQLGWLDQMAPLSDPSTRLWIIHGSPEECMKPSIRYGLSLLSLRSGSRRKTLLPVVFTITGDINAITLRLLSLFANALFIPADSPSLNAKITACLHTPPKPMQNDYRLGVHARPEYGVWFEIGPSAGLSWDGAFFGIDSADIDFHAVGDAYDLPERTMLQYEQRGLEIQSGGNTFHAWAVRNHITAEQSYYIRVRGIPGSILFGQYSTEDETMASIITLS
jgi:hypothetical protein